MQPKDAHTILVVEDDHEISTKMENVLLQRGHEVLLASNADKAMEMTEAHRPSMILTDLDMPTFASLMSRLREHRDFGKMVVAIIDINHPEVSDKTVKILGDFSQLDTLIASLPASNIH